MAKSQQIQIREQEIADIREDIAKLIEQHRQQINQYED